MSRIVRAKSTARWLVIAWLALPCCRSLAAGPLSPAQALDDLRVPAGFRIELAAAEPHVVDPVAIAFDEMGRMWVVEMRDYPSLERGKAPGSCIKLLEDRDKDGYYESASTFAEGLLFPTGVQPWRGGAFVTLAGEIAYMSDTDGDHRADRVTTWYRGFATANEQLRANHPRLASDGIIYVAGGLRGGQIANVREPQGTTISINGRDFAFDPLSGAAQAVSGNGQFGLTFDRFGRRFTCSNRNPLLMVVIEQRYLKQNPLLVPPKVVHDVAAAGADSRIYPRSVALTTSAQHMGQFTAACGVLIYEGNALPSESYGHAFVCEPTANVVHREALQPLGAVFSSQPVEHEAEFLSASDNWFRPVNLHTGPDGALYVVDMYRAVIEHPQWMPDLLRKRKDLRDGNDRGRIYRIVADSDSRRDDCDANTLATRSSEELVALLSHPNSWHRDTAFRLLLERQDKPLRAPLVELALEGTNPTGRFHALSLLHCLGELDDATLLLAFADPSPGVRERALVLSEERLTNSPELAREVMVMAADPSPRVRFQAALSLAMLPAERVVKPLRDIAHRDWSDPWTRLAVALSAREQASGLLQEVVRLDATHFSDADRRGRRQLIRELVRAIVARDRIDAMTSALAQVKVADRSTSGLLVREFAEALAGRGRSFDELLTQTRQGDQEAAHRIESLFDESFAKLVDGTQPDEVRMEAAALVALDARPSVVPALVDIVRSDAGPAVKLAAIGALAIHRQEDLPEQLIADVELQFPSVRRAIVDLLVTRRHWTKALLQAVAEGRLAAEDIDTTRSALLLNHQDPAIRELAQTTLGASQANRQELVQQYYGEMQLPGDKKRGKRIFLEHCANCHRVGSDGVAIGPDIGDASMKDSLQLVSDILNPNQAIDANFVAYTAITHAGLAYQGIIRSESDSGIELLTADGHTIAIPRDDLESLLGGKSMMPEGFERQISVEEMSDLVTFLRTWRQPASIQLPGELAPGATSN